MHEGQALQHKLQAAEPQQHAILAAQVAAEQTPRTAPILRRNVLSIPYFLGDKTIGLGRYDGSNNRLSRKLLSLASEIAVSSILSSI